MQLIQAVDLDVEEHLVELGLAAAELDVGDVAVLAADDRRDGAQHAGLVHPHHDDPGCGAGRRALVVPADVEHPFLCRRIARHRGAVVLVDRDAAAGAHDADDGIAGDRVAAAGIGEGHAVGQAQDRHPLHRGGRGRRATQGQNFRKRGPSLGLQPALALGEGGIEDELGADRALAQRRQQVLDGFLGQRLERLLEQLLADLEVIGLGLALQQLAARSMKSPRCRVRR